MTEHDLQIILDAETTARLRKVLSVPETAGGGGGGGRPVTINVNAIDAAGTFQFFQKNKRQLASLLGETRSTNHPIRRAT